MKKIAVKKKLVKKKKKKTVESSWHKRLCNINLDNVIGQRLRSQTSSIDYCESMVFSAIFDEPAAYEDAVNSKDIKRWISAMDEEFESLVKNQTWKLVDAPAKQNVIDNRWVFKVKTSPSGVIERFKARLVIRGFTQRYGVDYEETFSPVVKFMSLRAILSIAAAENMELKQFDIKTAFLNGDLDEVIFMKQPIGYDNGSGKVCKLLKSLYGLKQASRCWNKKFTEFIKKFNFKQCEADPCVFVLFARNVKVILAIYVDDGLIASNNKSVFESIAVHLGKEFKVKMGDAKCFLGLEIQQSLDGAIHLSQREYAQKV